MKKFFKTFICLITLLIPSFCFAGIADHPTVAVLPYSNKAAVSQQLSLADASLVSEFVVEKLIDSGYFNVVTRNRLLEVTQEQGFQAGSLVNPLTSVQMGKIAGAQYLVVGSVTGLSPKISGVGYENSERGSFNINKNTVIANLTLEFIDVETGFIVMAVSGTGESSSANAEFVWNQNRTEAVEVTVFDEATGVEDIGEDEITSTTTHKIRVGSVDFSQVQVRNALFKAADDLIFNKNYSVLAKIGVKNPNKIKRRMV